jgi:enamine deaminase RidA (YjgF/YER057c/UK114 family)
MSITRHDAGPRMSKAVVHGNTVYLAGIVADNAGGQSVAAQTKDILSIIDGFLAKAGTDKSKLLSANIWITDMSTFNEMNAEWDAWVSPGNTPARATVEANYSKCRDRAENPRGLLFCDRCARCTSGALRRSSIRCACLIRCSRIRQSAYAHSAATSHFASAFFLMRYRCEK